MPVAMASALAASLAAASAGGDAEVLAIGSGHGAGLQSRLAVMCASFAAVLALMLGTWPLIFQAFNSMAKSSTLRVARPLKCVLGAASNQLRKAV